VHETVQPELNSYHQRVQQIGEIVVNGLKMINKAAREGNAPEQGGEGQEMSEEQKAQQKLQQELEGNEMKHKQKLQHEFQSHQLKLQMIKEAGQQKMIMQAQDAMGKIATKDAEVAQRMARLRASSI
jgi:hypothetical protein